LADNLGRLGITVSSDLAPLLEGIRSGDEDAARELVRRYEKVIRVVVRTHLSDPRLRRQFDSLDVCQSVLASFFVNSAAGAYDLRAPAQVLALLTKMAQNKANQRIRNQYRKRRDVRRVQAIAVEDARVASTEPGPARRSEDRDLLNHVLAMMTPEIRAIAMRRMEGQDWPKIAATLGGTAEARRKQFDRAMLPIAQLIDAETSEI
jgi:DNA-directed RNA polymerase specialized sigma24 family protein